MIKVSCFIIFQGKIQGQITFGVRVGAQIHQGVQQIFHESQEEKNGRISYRIFQVKEWYFYEYNQYGKQY